MTIDRAAKMSSRIVAVSALSTTLIDSMYALHVAHYDGCERSRFDNDLTNKQYVILLDSPDALVGFSTVAVDRFDAANGPVQVLFSGDTVIDRAWWGEQVLSHTFARLAGALHARAPAVPLYWLLISKGHRTYRYLGLFSRRYFPHPVEPEPALGALANEIASARFGRDFDPETGVISFPESHGHLKQDIADVPERIAARPEGAFFLCRNPGYHRGDELVCLTELHADNLRGGVHTAFLLGCEHGLG